MSTLSTTTQFTSPYEIHDLALRAARTAAARATTAKIDRPAATANDDHPAAADEVEMHCEVEMLCAGDHPAEPIKWLWPGRIPIGKVSLLVGDPGLGKSLIALDVASRVTRGNAWPEQEKAEGGRGKAEGNAADSDPPPSTLPLPPSRGSVLILSADDDLADTIRPRLDAAGADPNRVFVLPKIADLRHDFAQLRAAVDRRPDCRLIIIDPVNAYVGPGDSHFHTVVRRVLGPLAELAAEKQIAILAITHLRKNDRGALQRAAGSMGFVAASRAIWTVCRDPQDDSRCLFLALKNNLGPLACGLAFRIENDAPTSAGQIVWDPTPITVPAREILRSKLNAAPRPTEREEAREFLRQALEGGPRPANRLLEEGDQRGFHRRMLQRAFHDLAGHTAKRGWKEGWWWSLGEYPVEVAGLAANNPPDLGREAAYAHDVAFQAILDEAATSFGDFAANDTAQPLSPSVALSPSVELSPSARMSPSATGPRSTELPQPPFRPPTPRESMAYLDRARAQRQPASRPSCDAPKSPDPALAHADLRTLGRMLVDSLQQSIAAEKNNPSAANGDSADRRGQSR